MSDTPQNDTDRPASFYMTAVFVLPFVVYLVGANLAAWQPQQFAAGYTVLALITSGVLCWSICAGNVLQPHKHVGAAVAIGFVGIAVWIGLSGLRLEERLAVWLPTWLQPGERTGFDPYSELQSIWACTAFIAVRVFGLAVIVPLAEELFWRGFLLRWIIDEDFEKVSIGQYSLRSCVTVVLLFTIVHPEWLAAAIYCAMLNALIYWKKDLWCCVVAHGVSNLALAAYVLATRSWWLW
jgi:CAAX prenyl protease-like protein